MNDSIKMIDEKYERVMSFAKKHGNVFKHNGISNLYVLTLTDKDGNIVDEKYGSNLLTDYGISQWLTTSTNFPTTIYIGNGTDNFGVASNTLVAPLTTTGSTVSSSTIDYKYPLYYDSITGLVTCTCKFASVYFPASTSGLTEDVRVTEYGLGTAYNLLWTHAWVYDNTGQQSDIVKYVDVQLNIDVYMCLSYNESLILDDWSNGKYKAITTMQQFMSNSNHMKPSNVYTYKRNNQKSACSITHTVSALTDNNITLTTNVGNITIYPESNTTASDKSGYGYMDGFCQYTKGCMFVERHLKPRSIPFDVVAKSVYDNASKNSCISSKFGVVDSTTPFTQADISAVYLYDHKTHSFDNPESFVNDSSTWYTEDLLKCTFEMPLYYKVNNTIETLYLFQNINRDDPIIKFNDTGIGTIYACDKYWDSSTWNRIDDLNNIPESLQTKPYYLTNSFSISLDPVRKSTGLKLTPPLGGIVDYDFYTASQGVYRTCDNYEYGWFLRGDICYVPSSGIHFNVTNESHDATTFVFTYRKWMVVLFNNTSAGVIKVYDMSDLSTIPTPTEVVIPSATITNIRANMMRSYNGNGLLVLQGISVQESYVIDMRDENAVTGTLITSTARHSCSIWGTTKMAYISSDNINVLNIYDIDTQAIVNTCEIPSQYTSTTIKDMIGHTNYVWLTGHSNGSMTHMFDITTSVVSECECTGSTSVTTNWSTSNLKSYNMTAVDDCLILYNRTLSCNMFIKLSNPTNIENPISILNLSQSSYDYFSYNSNFGRIFDLRYINNGKTLACLVSYTPSRNGIFESIFDMGRYIDTGTTSGELTHYYTNASSNILNNTGICPFGEFYVSGTKRIPISHYLPHRIVGTTNTISTIGTIQSITNKQYTNVLTNLPDFRGLRPGKELSL